MNDWMLLLEVPSLLFYIFVLFVIWTSSRPKLHTSFYVLVYIMGISDIGGYLTNLLTRYSLSLRDPTVALPLSTVFSLLNKTFSFGHQNTLMLLALNRYTAICKPYKHKILWRKKHLKVWAILTAIFAFLFNFNFYLSVIFYGHFDSNWELLNHPKVNLLNRIICTLQVTAPCVIASLLTLQSLRVWRQQRQSPEDQKHQKNLLIYAITIIGVIFPLVIYQALKVYAIAVDNQKLMSILSRSYYSVYFLFNFSAPYTLLLLCPSVRRECLRLCRTRSLKPSFKQSTSPRSSSYSSTGDEPQDSAGRTDTTKNTVVLAGSLMSSTVIL